MRASLTAHADTSHVTRARSALQKAWLFHYAGHGFHSGVEGYESALPLASHTQLSLGDVLTLGSAPQRVILSACEGAKVAEDGGISLAHAFVAAGSEAVLAAPRPVSDATAEALSRSLYDRGAARPGASLVQLLRETQLQISPDSDAWSFRIVVP